MITINNKSRYFSASEDMFPTMERNFAWLFGMQTPEQGWKTHHHVPRTGQCRGRTAVRIPCGR